MAKMDRITGRCARCPGMATSEVITLTQRLKLCAHCVLGWWQEFMESRR